MVVCQWCKRKLTKENVVRVDDIRFNWDKNDFELISKAVMCCYCGYILKEVKVKGDD